MTSSWRSISTGRNMFRRREALLPGLARNRAISLYRKQRKDLPLPEEQADGEPAGPDRTAQLEQAMDVERAVSQLNETDQNIIRMKYYGSMSISEIAETLHIPYETVKKRHTRSIKRLRKLLITILVIAALLVLAACGVIRLLRYFGLLPGYGIVTEPGVSCSLMQEHTPTVQTEQYTAWIESARLYNGELTVEYRLEVPEQPFETEWDEAGVAVGQGDGQPSRDQTAFKGLQDAVLVGAQIQAGISGMGVFGKLNGGIETLYVDGNVGHGITLACRALAETHRRL